MTQPIPQLPVSRRTMLHRMGAGFGSLGLAGVLQGADATNRPQVPALASAASPLSPKLPHFAPKAKRIIQLFMPGGPSQVDTFDYKPEINRYGGQRPTLVNLSLIHI